MTTESTTSVGSASDVLQLTLPLHQFIEIALQYGVKDKIIISEELGCVIESLDNDNLCHIQYKEVDNNIVCYLWSKKDWNVDYQKWIKDREDSERNKLARWLLQENITIVAKALSKLTAMPIEDMKATAYKIIQERNGTKLAALGVTLKEKL